MDASDSSSSGTWFSNVQFAAMLMRIVSPTCYTRNEISSLLPNLVQEDQHLRLQSRCLDLEAENSPPHSVQPNPSHRSSACPLLLRLLLMLYSNLAHC